ncbi:MAG: HAD-IA family hydrolase [Actinomycetota bacterium]|nr:HAD-IA family hydrolase [Actinomycetota bacterium]
MSAASHRSRAAAPPAAVLFDMDGTLVDTEPYWIECEYELVERFGDAWDDDKAHSLVGFDLRDAAEVLQARGGVQLEIDEIVNRLLDGVIARVNRAVPWRPGARELLADLNAAGIPCAMVTMSWQRLADAVVDILPEGTFAAVISGDMVTNGKPHPEPYLAAARALRVPAQHCVAVEDSPTGIRSAVAARCITFAVPNVVDIAPGAGYTVVPSLDDIPRAALGLASPSRERRVAGARRTAQHHRRRVVATFAALAAALGLAAGGVLLLRDEAPPPPYPDMAVSVWAPYWELDVATASIATNGALIHEVSPFWYTAKDASTITYAANITVADTATFEAAARASGAKVIPSVTDSTGPGAMAAILADPFARERHVQALVAIAKTYDGIDIDYEAFAFTDAYATWEATRPNWVAFVQELAAALHDDGKLLVVTIPPVYDTERTPDSGRWVYDPKAIGEVADAIRVMAYDYSVETPGPIAPIEWVQTVVRAFKQLVADDSKIVLGIPLYGRNWVTATKGTCPDGTPGRVSPSQIEVAALMQEHTVVPVHDPTFEEAVFTYQRLDDTGVCTQTREVRFMDALGVLARIDLARTERIGGVAFWAMGFETADTWAAIAPVARPR